MKFITEDDLRDLYKKEPFTTYALPPETRLTPGARQFLADRGINMFDDDPRTMANKKVVLSEQPSAPKEETKKKSDWRSKKLYCRIKSVEALFFSVEEDLLTRDVVLAQNVMNLGRQLALMRNTIAAHGQIPNLLCQECTGIKDCNFSEDLQDCFEITEFHLQLEKGKDILALHRLRCALHELEPLTMEYCEYEGSEDSEKWSEDFLSKVNQMINTLSQMICTAVGGKTCQRKN